MLSHLAKNGSKKLSADSLNELLASINWDCFGIEAPALAKVLA